MRRFIQESLDIVVDINAGVANVRIQAMLVSPFQVMADGVLKLPTPIDGTTMSSAAVILKSGRVIDTVIIDEMSVEKVPANDDLARAASSSGVSGYDPGCFQLPVPSLDAGERAQVELSYFVPMPFDANSGQYRLRLPMNVPGDMLAPIPPFSQPKPQGGGWGFGGRGNAQQGYSPPACDLQHRLRIHIDVQAGTPHAGPGEASHAFNILTPGAAGDLPPGAPPGFQVLPPGSQVTASRFSVELDTTRPAVGRDVEFSYRAWSPVVAGTALVEAASPSAQGPVVPAGNDFPPPGTPVDGNFVLFMSPPQLSRAAEASGGVLRGRAVVLLVDNSGSMAGRPMELAKEATLECLRLLQPNDCFSICVYNHRQKWWRPGAAPYSPGQHDPANQHNVREDPYHPTPLNSHQPGQPSFLDPGVNMQPAVPQAIAEASAWVRSISTTGMTNILTPVAQSYTAFSRQPPPPPGMRHVERVPVVLLVTDGAVDQDHRIVKYVRESNAGLTARCRGGPTTLVPRVFTFGIGKWVNSFFLRMLAQFGRGYFDHALRLDDLSDRIAALMQRASAPVLTDLQVGVPGATSIEVYPFPVPDLYCGAPVVVSGRFTGPRPQEVFVRAFNGAGHPTVIRVPVESRGTVPVQKVFAKQQLDLLSANHWLAEAEAMDEELMRTRLVEASGGGGRAGSVPNQADQRAAKQRALANAAGLRERIVDLSVTSGIPCAHTSMVAYPTTTDDYRAQWAPPPPPPQTTGAVPPPPDPGAAGLPPPVPQAQFRGGGPQQQAGPGYGMPPPAPQPQEPQAPMGYGPGAAGQHVAPPGPMAPPSWGGTDFLRGGQKLPPPLVDDDNGGKDKDKRSKSKKGKKGRKITALQVGGIVVGTTLVAGVAIGSVAATVGGLGFANALPNFTGRMPGFDCCNIPCGDCGGLAGSLDQCFGQCGDCCTTVVGCVPNAVGDAFGACTDCSGGVFDAVSGGFQACFGVCGDVVGSCGDCFGTVAGSCAAACNNCGDLAGAAGQCLGGVAETIGPCLQGAGQCIGGLCEALGSL